MKKFNYLSLIIILLCFFAAPNNLFANYKESGKDKDNGKKPGLEKTTVNPSQSIMNINNATMWVTDEGFHDWVVASGWNGAYPNGATVGAIFAEGILWGGKVSDGQTQLIRVNGNTYGTGCAPVIRLFRVRPDYLTGNLLSDAATYNDIPLGSVTEAQIQEIRDQYALDWQEWPADEGALYDDVDNDGQYNPDIDIPGVPGASQTIFIKYDDRDSESNYGSIPIGLEVSETYWAYAYSGALGNVIYKKVDIVYKGTPNSAANSVIDSMYIVQWADPDVGNSSDDFAGCDTVLNLGYAYSSGATDNSYEGIGLPPPAAGYDFLQGVSVYTGDPSDSAIFDLKWRKGYAYVNPVPMSSFEYFAAGGTWSDPGFDYEGTQEFYNLMRGARPTPKYPAFSPFPESVADVTPFGTYLLTGDPVAGTGKIDGTVDGPGDRRIMVTNGPITMHLGDTAQVVLGLVYGMGTDNLSSITAMKTNDLTAQIVFDQLFQLPAIKPPVVQVANLENQIVLNWGSDATSVGEIEGFEDQNYTFEGYEIYQVPNATSSLEDATLLGTVDRINGVTAVYDTVIDVNGIAIPVLSANGTDNGISRFMVVDYDNIKNQPLYNGQEYYFAVVAYATNPSPLLPFHVLRSPFIITPTKPQFPLPGVRYTSSTGDTVQIDHSSGTSDGSAFGIVLDPTATTGHSYSVNFDSSGAYGVTDETTAEIKASGLTNQTGNEEYPIVDGILVKVLGPTPGINQISELDENDEVVDANVSYIPPSLGTTGYLLENRAGTANGEFGDRTFDRFQYWGSDDVIIDFTDSSYSWDYINETVHVDTLTGLPTYAPFAVYRRKFPSGETVRLFAGYWDTNGDGTWSNNGADDWAGPIYGAPSYEPIYCFQGYDASGNEINYDPANESQYAIDNDLYTSAYTTFGDATGPIHYPYMTATLFTMYLDGATPPWGHKVIFYTNKPNGLADVYTYTAPDASTSRTDLAKSDVENINVFPNPYYGFHNNEIAANNKFVTFSHLPDNATIRIFDLSGVLVKTINHVSTSGQFDTWDLQNDNNYPVASGVYIAYIDMPDLGTTKILKLAVIQEQQMLKVY